MRAKWKAYLYDDDQYNEWKDYQKIEHERREQLEKHHGIYDVFNAFVNKTCKQCGNTTENFNIVTCSRACLECWRCQESGERGLGSNSDFALCAVGFAKSHFLLSDAEIGKLFVLAVDDATRAHGLISSKMSVVSQAQARAASFHKFGGAQGLADEKSKRADKSKSAWLTKCAAAEAAGKSKPKKPDLVKFEEQKDAPQHWNFITRNQRSADMLRARTAYGLYSCYSTTKIMLSAPPTIVVTDDSLEEVQNGREAGGGGGGGGGVGGGGISRAPVPTATAVYTNLIDALADINFERKAFVTLLIDKHCDLPSMFRSADQAKLTAAGCLCPHAQGVTVGGRVQANTVMIYLDISILGTDRARITSDSANLWLMQNTLVKIENLRLSTVVEMDWDDIGDGDWSPCVVSCTRSEIERCNLSVNGFGYDLLAHGPTKMFNSTLRQSNMWNVHFDETFAANVSYCQFKNCTFICGDAAFFDDTVSDISEFLATVNKENKFTRCW